VRTLEHRRPASKTQAAFVDPDFFVIPADYLPNGKAMCGPAAGGGPAYKAAFDGFQFPNAPHPKHKELEAKGAHNPEWLNYNTKDPVSLIQYNLVIFDNEAKGADGRTDQVLSCFRLCVAVMGGLAGCGPRETAERVLNRSMGCCRIMLTGWTTSSARSRSTCCSRTGTAARPPSGAARSASWCAQGSVPLCASLLLEWAAHHPRVGLGPPRHQVPSVLLLLGSVIGVALTFDWLFKEDSTPEVTPVAPGESVLSADIHLLKEDSTPETKIVQGWPKLRDLAQHFD
jgi:hypothetical protein